MSVLCLDRDIVLDDVVGGPIAGCLHLFERRETEVVYNIGLGQEGTACMGSYILLLYRLDTSKR